MDPNTMWVDEHEDRVTVEVTGRTVDGLPALVVRLIAEPDHGYLVADEGRGGFGTAECPSSYGLPCVCWFGPGERYPDAASAIAAVAD